MTSLAAMKIEPIRAASQMLTEAETADLKPQVEGWSIIEKDGEKRLERGFKFANFAEALDFTIKIGRIADEVDHHPALLTEWGRVTVTWWTHKIKGLHRNDFIMAARTGQIYEGQ